MTSLPVKNGCTRNKAAGQIEVPPPNTKKMALWNMAVTWNAIPDQNKLVAKSEGSLLSNDYFVHACPKLGWPL